MLHYTKCVTYTIGVRMDIFFEIAAASVTGAEHQRRGMNCQDGLRVNRSGGSIVAVVCDGCGSTPHSEVGAKLAAQMIGAHLMTLLSQSWENEDIMLEALRQDVLAELRIAANWMGTPLTRIIGEYLLFTVVGVYVTAAKCGIFSIGDGVYAVNGTVRQLGPFPGNQPPYLAYGLLENNESPRFILQELLNPAEVNSLFVGTDGVGDLLAAESACMPGKVQQVGAVSQFWRDDAYFVNPDQLRRKLMLVNKEVKRIDWENRRVDKVGGLLSDDTSLIVLRRKVTQERGPS